MKKSFKKVISIVLVCFLLTAYLPAVSVFAASSLMEIFDKDKALVTERINITEYSTHQLYAMAPSTDEAGVTTGTELDTSDGSYVTWESNLPLLAGVDNNGKVTAYDFSKRAVLEAWIDENIRSMPIVGESMANSIWDSINSTGVDIDDMSNDMIVAIVRATAGDTLANSLQAILDSLNVEITATWYGADGKKIASDTVEVIVEKSTLANLYPTGVHITNKKTVPKTVAVGAQVQLYSIVTPSRLNAESEFEVKTSIFDNSAKEVASVTKDGLVTFLKPGEVTIKTSPTNALYSAVTDEVKFTVLSNEDYPLESFDILGGSSVGEGETLQLYIDNVTPDGSYLGAVTWESADPTVAVVDENGLVTGLDGGSGFTYSREVAITATSEFGVSQTVTIKVTRPLSNSISSIVIEGEDSIGIGDTGSYIATAKPDRINESSSLKREWGVIDPVTQEIIIATNDTPATDGVVSVDTKGNVTALGSGVATIYVKGTINSSYAEDRKSIVCGNAITDFEITGNATEIKEGKTVQLSVNVLAPEDYETALLDTVVWTVSDESVASVSDTGLVLGRDAGSKTGSKTITVTATVSGISRTYNVTVKGPGTFGTNALTDANVDGLDCVIVDLPRQYSLYTYPTRIEGTATYYGLATDEGAAPWDATNSYDGSNRNVENSVARISDDGIVSGKMAGETSVYGFRKSSTLGIIGRSYVEAHKDIKIIEIEPKSITIKTPDKLEYLEGDTELDLTGLEVYLNYDKNMVAEYYPDAVDYTDAQLTAQVTDYEVGSFNPDLWDVTQYVIVSVTRAGKTYNAVIPIVVKSKVVSKLNLVAPNKNLYIEGEELDLKGMSATVDYENYETEAVTDYQVDYDSFSYDILDEEQNVRVYYTHAGRTVDATFPITIFGRPEISANVEGTVGAWTHDNIVFTFSATHIRDNVTYYYKTDSNEKPTVISGNKFTIKADANENYYFMAAVIVNAYKQNVTIYGDWTEPYHVMFDNTQPDFRLEQIVSRLTNEDYDVDIANITTGISGLDYIKVDGKTLTDDETSFTVSKNGVYEVEVASVVGLSTTKSIEINNIDKEAPTVTSIEISKVDENAPENHFGGIFADYYGGAIVATATAEDSGVAGVDLIKYRLVDAKYNPVTEWEYVTDEAPAVCDTEFQGYFEFRAIDRAGNESSSLYSDGFTVDTVKPVITEIKAVYGDKEYKADTWANDIVEFTPVGDAFSGIYEWYYNINGGEWIKLTSSQILAREDGIFEYNFKAVSFSGLESDVYPFTVKIDRTVPVVRVSLDGTIGRWTNEDVTFTLSTVAKHPSGVTYFVDDGNGWAELKDNVKVIDYSSNSIYKFKAVTGSALESASSDEYKVMVDKVLPTAQVIKGVTGKTDSPYDIAIVPQTGEAGLMQIYFNGVDVTDTLTYTVTENGTYNMVIIGNNMLSSSQMVVVDNFSKFTTMDFEYEENSDGTAKVTLYNGNAKNVTVPMSVDEFTTTEIADGTFANKTTVEAVNVPNTVKTIGNAFSGCSNLKEITIPQSVEKIADGAFVDCENVTIYCYNDSYALAYAKQNNIPYVVLDLKVVGNTIVNNDINCIFTEQTYSNNIENIVSVEDGSTVLSIPSFISGSNNYYGTGSVVYHFKNGVVVNSYTVIVYGDINGDSAVDVLDMSTIEKVSNSHGELKENYLLAADLDNNGNVETADFQRVVNIGLR